jgi:molecular chaperone HscA
MRARALVEARVDAQRLVLATQTALHADGDLLSAQERAAVDGAIAALQTSAQGEDAAQIEASSKILAQVTEAFAAQRMNRGIAQALSGHTLDSLQDSFKN